MWGIPERSRVSLHNEAYLIRTPMDSVRLSSTGRTVYPRHITISEPIYMHTKNLIIN